MASPDSLAVPADRYDADRLLAGYQTARAQEALFDLRHGPGMGYDEFVDNDGNVRPAWAELAATGIEVPGRHQLFMHACDVSRLADGSFQVNADWTQAPSGAGYALADRRVITHAVPDLYERIAPRPTTPFAQALRLALIDA